MQPYLFFKFDRCIWFTHVRDNEDSSLLRGENSPVFFKQIGCRVVFFFFFLSVERAINHNVISSYWVVTNNECVIWLDGRGGHGGGDHLFPRAVPDHLLMSRHSRYSVFLWTKWQIISLWMIRSHTHTRACTHTWSSSSGKIIVCWQHLWSTLRHNGFRNKP